VWKTPLFKRLFLAAHSGIVYSARVAYDRGDLGDPSRWKVEQSGGGWSNGFPAWGNCRARPGASLFLLGLPQASGNLRARNLQAAASGVSQRPARRFTRFQRTTSTVP